MADTNLLQRLKGAFATNTTPPGDPPAPRIDAVPYGQSGRYNFAGIPQYDEINAKLIGPAGQYLFDTMYRQDPDIRRLVLMAWSPIQSGSWTLEPYGGDDASHQDHEIADTIWYGLNTFMAPTFTEHLAELGPLLLRAGFLPCEQLWSTWDYKGKTYTFPKSLQVRLPRSVWKWPQDDYGNMTGIVQFIPGRSETFIPAEDLVYYRLAGEGDNWMGTSLLRQAYKPWMYKDKLERIDAIGQERKAVGIPIVYPPQGADDQTKQAVEQLFASMHLSEVAYAMMPGPKQGLTGMSPGEGWLVDVIQFDSSSGSSIKDSLAYHKDAIASSFLGDFMQLGHHQVGARATAQVQDDPFLTAVQSLAGYAVGPLNKLVDRIVKLNWPDAEGSPTFSLNLVDAASLSEISGYVQQLVAAGAMQADPELEDWLRERANLPPANADMRQQALQQKQAEAQSALMGAQDPTGPHGENFQPPVPPTVSNNGPGRGNQQLSLDTPSPKWYENLLSQGRLKDALDGARNSVENVAREPATAVANQIVNGDTPDTTHLAEALHGEYQRLYHVGHQTAMAEIAGQRKTLMSPTDVAAAVGARLARARQRAEQSAQNIAHEITKRVAQAQIAGLKEAPALTASALEAAKRQLHQEALDNASAQINDGRFDAASANPDVVGAYYTSVLDSNTCDDCEAADTGDLLTLDDAEQLGPPNPDCQGGDRCRCMMVFVTSSDPTAP